MGLLSSFFKRPKAPQIPNVQLPGLGDYFDYPALEDFANKRISGDTAGFGPDFVTKNTNPVAMSRMTRLREQEIPEISSQASKRGIARSSLVTDQIGKAERNANQDIDELMSKFYYLDQAQRKKDITEGVGVKQGLLDRAINRANSQAELDVNIPVKQGSMNLDYLKNNQSMDNNLIQGVGTLLSGLGTRGGYNFGALGGGGTTRTPVTRANILSMDNNSFQQWLDQYFGG